MELKVEHINTFLVDSGSHNNWLFVKVDTNEGISGWGEAYTGRGREESIQAYINKIKPFVIGRSPYDIKNFKELMYSDFAGRRTGLEYFCAISSIELALWDIVGKSFNTPIYNLFGGACRDKIKVYATAWEGGCQTAEEYAMKANETIKMGFKALKFDPFKGPYKTYISRQEEVLAARLVKNVRAAVGDEVELLIEAHRRLSPMNAIRFARRIEEYEPMWYEEPVVVDSLDALADVKRQVNLPVVTGETLYTKMDFLPVFEKRAADIINPDVYCTGILELREIAAIAEAFKIAVAPHNSVGTTVGLAATLQISACLPNFLIAEYFVNMKHRGDEILMAPFKIDDGFIKLPRGPGLGINIDENMLSKYPGREFAMRSIRQYMD